jgi:hypothetical protein
MVGILVRDDESVLNLRQQNLTGPHSSRGCPTPINATMVSDLLSRMQTSHNVEINVMVMPINE